MSEEQGEDKLDRQLGELERILHDFPRRAFSGQSNAQNFNINAGGWIATLFMAACFAFSCVSTTLYITARSDWNAEKTDIKAQSRADVQRLEGEIKELRGQSETQQAYLNEIYRTLKK